MRNLILGYIENATKAWNSVRNYCVNIKSYIQSILNYLSLKFMKKDNRTALVNKTIIPFIAWPKIRRILEEMVIGFFSQVFYKEKSFLKEREIQSKRIRNPPYSNKKGKW